MKKTAGYISEPYTTLVACDFGKMIFSKAFQEIAIFFENSVKSKKNLTERKKELSAELMLFLQFSMYFSPLPPQLRSEVCDFSV